MGLEHTKKELYDMVKRRFLKGELIADITRELEIAEPTTMLNIVQNLSKDFDVERAVRMDQLLMDMLRYATGALNEANGSADKKERDDWFNHAERAFALFDRASKNNKDFRDWKASRRRGKGKQKPRPAANPTPGSEPEPEPDDTAKDLSFEELL